MTGRRRSYMAGLAGLVVAFGVFVSTAPAAEAMTKSELKAEMQLLAAQEKAAKMVFDDLAAMHGSDEFLLMEDAEARDLAMVRELLSDRGWKDLTKGDVAGEFRNFPLVEQMYYDMVFDGQGSVADAARVGQALQQMTLGTINDLLGANLTKSERKDLDAARFYAFNNLVALQEMARNYS
jgi:hypothetical protein